MKLPLKSVLARNTLWMSIGQGMRLLVQAAYFTVIARSLGTTNYGAFVGVSALVGIVYPFGSLGSGNIMIKDVARDPTTFRVSWGAALIRTILFGCGLIVLILSLSHFALPAQISWRLVSLVAISDIIGLNLILLSAFSFQAVERLNWTSLIYVLISVFRLAAAVILVSLHPHPSALEWAYAYVSSTFVVAILAFFITGFKLGWPQVIFGKVWSSLREGFYFAAGLSAQTIYNDLDKTMLARLGTLEATGIYGAAYRLIEVSFSPVLALLSATYPSFFRVGINGIRASIAYAKPLLRRAVVFATIICIVLILAAGLVPIVLGSEYVDAGEALRWLALILPLRTIHAFLSDILTSAGRQGLRTAIQIGAAVINALINCWAIPAYSWRGAAFSSVVCDALLAIGVGMAVVVLERRAKVQPPGIPNDVATQQAAV